MTDHGDHQLIAAADAQQAERARWHQKLAAGWPAQPARPMAPRTDGMTPVAHFLCALAVTGYLPTAKELETLAYQLHATSVDLPEMEVLTVNFEALGDAWHKAGLQLESERNNHPWSEE